ncbi:MAG: class I SAM-dependent methyltransferase [Methylococcales bacterium]
MLAISDLKQWARETSPNLYNRYLKYHRASLLPKLSSVLSDSRNPVTLSEEEFDILQGRYKQWWPQYDYDAYGIGRRAYERALSFLNIESLREPGKNVLEIACGDGMSGTALSIYGHQVTLLDYQDWRDSRAYGLNFIQADLGKPIPLPNSSYDFIFSFNAFEHIPDPELAINEMVRILRPGGLIWIDFNPLYASPLGLHAFCFKMPYPQFLFSDSLIQSKLKDLGLNDLGHEMEALQPLNHWRSQQFRELWHRTDCNVIQFNENIDFKHLDIVLQYPQAFRGRDLCLDDLTIAGMRVVLQKH